MEGTQGVSMTSVEKTTGKDLTGITETTVTREQEETTTASPRNQDLPKPREKTARPGIPVLTVAMATAGNTASHVITGFPFKFFPGKNRGSARKINMPHPGL